MGSATQTSARTASTDVRIAAACVSLRLPTVRKMLNESLTKALGQGQDARDVLADVLEAEVEERDARRVQRRLREACFPRVKTLDDFDFNRNTELPAALLRRLATNEYLETAENVVLVGDPGTGKARQ